MANKGILKETSENLLQVHGFEAVVTKEIDDQGRISGFARYAGRKCMVIIEKSEGC